MKNRGAFIETNVEVHLTTVHAGDNSYLQLHVDGADSRIRIMTVKVPRNKAFEFFSNQYVQGTASINSDTSEIAKVMEVKEVFIPINDVQEVPLLGMEEWEQEHSAEGWILDREGGSFNFHRLKVVKGIEVYQVTARRWVDKPSTGKVSS